MQTGSLRARVIVTTVALFAIVLTVVVTAVTAAYRASLRRALRFSARMAVGPGTTRDAHHRWR